MRAAWRDADRAAEIRDAAAGWREVGLLDETAFAALGGSPAAGPALGPTWRVLIFVCVCVGISAAVVLTFIGTDVRGAGAAAALLLLWGLGLAVVTDIVVERCAFRATGAEAATSLLALSCLVAAAFALNDHLHLRGAAALRPALTWSGLVLALAAWRWGFRLYAGAAAVSLLLLSTQFPLPRLGCVVLAALLLAAAARALGAHGLAPSHRGGLHLVRLAALAAIYAAANYLSVEKGLIEEIGRVAGAPHHRAGETALLLAAVLSAAYPLALLAWGLRRRDRLLLDCGAVSALLSLATLRFYVDLAPLWAVLVGLGAALCAASLALERWLRAEPDGERGGFTAAALSGGGRRGRLLPVAAALAVAPGARELPPEEGGPGGGGGFGGGGATGTY